MRKYKKHLVIPDCQVAPGRSIEHLRWINNYIKEKQPDVIINLGDFNDMRSLNGYTVGQASAEGKRYSEDIRYGKEAMSLLCAGIVPSEAGKHYVSYPKKVSPYRPKMVLTLGNHEYRIAREAEKQPKFKGTLQLSDLGYEGFGWKVVPFLQVITIDGIKYSHYFTSGVMGRPVGSAQVLLRECQSSATMGHVQCMDFARHKKTKKSGLFAGVCYTHDEGYLGPQDNNPTRQIVVKHEIHDGVYDPMFVSLNYLKRKYS